MSEVNYCELRIVRSLGIWSILLQIWISSSVLAPALTANAIMPPADDPMMLLILAFG